MNRYVEGMKEIKADEYMRKELLKSIQQKRPARSQKWFSSKKAALPLAAACVLLALTIFSAALLRPDRAPALTAGFVIHAYAADGSAIEVKPNVEFPLGKYSPLMSSVPGFPLAISSEEAESVTLKSTHGSFSQWTASTSRILQKGRTVTILPGETLYWSPLAEDRSQTLTESSTITVIAFKDNNEIGRRIIEIKANIDRSGEEPLPYYYSGVLLEPQAL